MTEVVPVRQALVSVSDKSGLTEFAQALAHHGVSFLATGGTRRALEQAGVSTRDIAEYTQFPEMLGGRVKTLHPNVFGAILARRDRSDDLATCLEHGIELFDLVVVNLYPFKETIARPGMVDEEAIEQIDIGGPSLIRAAAKNHRFVAVITSPDQHAMILSDLAAVGGIKQCTRRKLAQAAFEHTSAYDLAIAEYFQRTRPRFVPGESSLPDEPASKLTPSLSVSLTRVDMLRYGENPHQAAALYASHSNALPLGASPSLTQAAKRHGKELSYNNYLDLDAALAIARDLPSPGAVVIKHTNPCGAATGQSLSEAAAQALAGDPVSAFGSVLGFNQPVDLATAEMLAAPGNFIEAIIAPGYEPAAFECLTTKPKWKNNVRLLELSPFGGPSSGSTTTEGPAPVFAVRAIDGGLLVQSADVSPDPVALWKVVTQAQPTEEQWADLKFAWSVVRHVKSNAITIAGQGTLRGSGAGQMSRVDSVRIALEKAGQRARQAVLASDAFFPFPDSVEQFAAAGIQACIQPGGSKNDAEVIAACDRLGVAMVFTGRRHFRH